jgi:hypothetical protein
MAQDLSGFDHMDEAAAAQRMHSQSGASSSPRQHSPIPAYRGGGGGGAISSSGDASISGPLGLPSSNRAGEALGQRM